MKKPRGIIFDFGSTILHETSFDALSGNVKLLEFAANPPKFIPTEIRTFADEIYLDLRKAEEELNVQVSFQSFQKLLYETLGITMKISNTEAERYFWHASTDFKPTEGIFGVLDLLKENGIRTAVLSNTGFSGYLLEEELEKHNLSHYFSFVISSSDYGFRKPSPRVFKVAIKKLNLEPSDIWFVGDKLEYDIKGAIQSGLYPVWYNPGGKINTTEYDCLEVKSWREFSEKLKSIF